MKKKYVLALILAIAIFWLPLKASTATIKDNHLNFDTDRVAQEQNQTLGQQSNQVKDLFNPEDQTQLAKSKDGKKALTSQEGQLFQKGRVITTSAKQKSTTLFQSRVTHALDINEGQEGESINWLVFWLYCGIITLALGLAACLSWWFHRQEEKDNELY